MNKSTTHQPQLSRQTITSWIHSLLHDVPTNLKIQELGKGTIYCRIINYYCPGTILANRIIVHPKSEYENTINLKMLQNGMAQIRINIPIDPIRLSKQKLGDNWTFATSLYRYLTQTHQEHYPHPPKEDKSYGYHPQMIASSNLNNPKRSIEHVYPDNFYKGTANRQPLFQLDNIMPQKGYLNAGKYSVSKMYRQNEKTQNVNTSSPNKGKWSVNSIMFQNNLMPIIDRIKEILLKSSHDTEKIRQIKMLLNIPLNEEVVVKVEDDQNAQITMISPSELGADKLQSSSTTLPKQELK